MKLSFPLGACRFSVGFSWFALLAFCCLFGGEAGGAFPLLAMLCHEGAHLGVMAAFHCLPKLVELTALGCRMVLDPRHRLTLPRQAMVSLAGPAGNLLCWGLCRLGGAGESPFAWASLALGVFHLLPAEPLDGGLALRAGLTACFGYERGRLVSLWVSLGVIFLLGVLGFLVLLRTRYNFSLLGVSLYLMLTLVLREDHFT